MLRGKVTKRKKHKPTLKEKCKRERKDKVRESFNGEKTVHNVIGFEFGHCCLALKM